MADYRKRLAERLIYERENAGLSQKALALRADVDEKTIKRIEQQRTTARPVTVRRLAEALKVDPGVLRPPDELEEDQLNRIERKLDQLLDHLDLAELEEIANGDSPARDRESEQTRAQRA